MKRKFKVDFRDKRWTPEQIDYLMNTLETYGIALPNYSIPPMRIFEIDYAVDDSSVSVGDKVYLLDAFFEVSDYWYDAESGQIHYAIIIL